MPARERAFVIVTPVGSVAGALVGSLPFCMVPGPVLLPALTAILIVSA